MITFPLLNDLKNTPKTEWPSVVKNHKLTHADLQKACEIIKAGKLEDEWFNMLYIECKGCGLLQSDKVFDKYGIQGRLILKKRLMDRFLEVV